MQKAKLFPKPLIPVQFRVGVPFNPLRRRNTRDGNIFRN
jgi:hypothetical protein